MSGRSTELAVDCSIQRYVSSPACCFSHHEQDAPDFRKLPNADEKKVTFGLVLSGALPPIRGLFLFPAQLTAAMCAGGLVQAMTPGDIGATNTSLSPGTSVVQGVFIEMFMTAELVFVVLMLAAEKSKDTFLAPIGVGLALFVAMMGGMSLQTHALISESLLRLRY
jgi:hypothetical protein